MSYRSSETMIHLIAQIAPQRSTQYADLATTLAPHELRLSLPDEVAPEIRPLTLAGQAYLQFDLPHMPDRKQRYQLGTLAMSNAFFRCYEKLGTVEGPLLQPVETSFRPKLPPDLAMSRRYRGKTNEMFTHFLCNIARFSSRFKETSWEEMTVFDPLSGGGTTLLTALVLGANAAGVEQNDKDVESTSAFLQQYLREARIGCQVRKERVTGAGRRWAFEIGRRPHQRCLIAHGDTAKAAALISGFKPHLIVADLPYGIQHHGPLENLLTEALLVWASLLPKGGAMALAWESARFPREEMIALVEAASPLVVRNQPPYDALAHRVDRVIKQRDVLVAGKA